MTIIYIFLYKVIKNKVKGCNATNIKSLNQAVVVMIIIEAIVRIASQRQFEQVQHFLHVIHVGHVGHGSVETITVVPGELMIVTITQLLVEVIEVGVSTYVYWFVPPMVTLDVIPSDVIVALNGLNSLFLLCELHK